MLKVTITNEQGEVYVIATVVEQGIGRNDALVADDEGDVLGINELINDAIIWNRENVK